MAPRRSSLAGAGDPAGPAGVEREWQFDAVHLAPVQRWLVRLEGGPVSLVPGRARTHADTYFDTADLRIHQAGRTLRIRRTGRNAEATLKARGRQEDGLRQRAELTEALAVPDPTALIQSDGEVGRRVRDIAGRRPLRRLFEVRTRRQVYLLQLEGTQTGEVAMDRTVIGLAGVTEPARLRRVEVEVGDPSRPEIQEFVARLRRECGLQPAGLSKYEAGFLACGLEAPSQRDLGPTLVDPEASVGQLVFAVLRRHFADALAHEPGTRLGDDPEELHDMRVAVRRLRALTGIFPDVLPVRGVRLRGELRWLAGLLGAVRDLDVQIEQTRRWDAEREPGDFGASGALVAILEQQRILARRRLIDGLDSHRYDRLVEGFASFLRGGPLRRVPASAAPAVVGIPDVVRAKYHKVRKAGRHLALGSPPAAFHELRIRCKKLRYTLEAVTDLYGQPARDVIRRLVVLQDGLGEHQDAQVAIERLRTLASTPDQALPPEAVFAMGEMAERYAHRAVELRGSFAKPFGRLPKRWKRLRTAMAARSRAAAASRQMVPRVRLAPVPPPVVSEVSDGSPAAPVESATIPAAEPPVPGS
jgi:triphosphatase